MLAPPMVNVSKPRIVIFLGARFRSRFPHIFRPRTVGDRNLLPFRFKIRVLGKRHIGEKECSRNSECRRVQLQATSLHLLFAKVSANYNHRCCRQFVDRIGCGTLLSVENRPIRISMAERFRHHRGFSGIFGMPDVAGVPRVPLILSLSESGECNRSNE